MEPKSVVIILKEFFLPETKEANLKTYSADMLNDPEYINVIPRFTKADVGYSAASLMSFRPAIKF